MDEEIRKRIEEVTQENKGRDLTPAEEHEMQDGMALQEMTGTTGWQVLKSWIESLAYHSWVDPRGMKKEDWEFAELNAYHAANNAKELLGAVETMIGRAQELHKIKLGEIKNKRMRI